MTFFKQKSNIVFSVVIFLLIAIIGFLGWVVYVQQSKYIKTNASLTDNAQLLKEAEEKIKEYTAQIEQFSSELEDNKNAKAELEGKLNEALEAKAKLEEERARLQQENSGLRQQIELKARKKLQEEIRLCNTNQAGAADSGICYLTFDDGPSNNTLKILDILDTYGIKATFFVVGTAKMDYLPLIHSKGHAIGLHSTSHSYANIYSSVNNYLTDIKGISDIVYAKTGVRSNIMRFPGGSSNAVSASYCKGIMTELTTLMPSLGYSYYDWNVSSGDAAGGTVPSSRIVSNVLNGARGKKSICVLMHDTGAKGTTVQALPQMIEGLHSQGFRFAALNAQVYGFHQAVRN